MYICVCLHIKMQFIKSEKYNWQNISCFKDKKLDKIVIKNTEVWISNGWQNDIWLNQLLKILCNQKWHWIYDLHASMWNYLYLPSSLAINIVSFLMSETMFQFVTQTDMEFTMSKRLPLYSWIFLQLPEFWNYR